MEKKTKKQWKIFLKRNFFTKTWSFSFDYFSLDCDTTYEKKNPEKLSSQKLTENQKPSRIEVCSSLQTHDNDQFLILAMEKWMLDYNRKIILILVNVIFFFTYTNFLLSKSDI